MAKRQRARLTVVLPAWEAQPWWPLLAEMLIAPSIRLPRRLDTFLPGHLGNELPMVAPRWTAIAATISGAPCSTAVFRTRWRELCRQMGQHSHHPWLRNSVATLARFLFPDWVQSRLWTRSERHLSSTSRDVSDGTFRQRTGRRHSFQLPLLPLRSVRVTP